MTTHRKMQLRHKWTDEEIEYVRVHYRGNNQSAQEIAEILGVTFYGVKGQIQKLGIQKNTDYRKEWTPEEEDHLRKLLSNHSVRQISFIMKRSQGSLINKIKRLRLSRRIRIGWYTKQEACEVLGVDHKWIQRRIDDGKLNATYHDGVRPSPKGMQRWHIDEKNLADFIRNYAGELDSRNVDLVEIVHLLDTYHKED